MTPKNTASRNRPGVATAKISGQQRDLLVNFVEASTVALLLFDENLNVMAVNPAAEKLAGWTNAGSAGIDGNNILDYMPDLKGSGRYDKYLSVIKTGEPLTESYVVPRDTGNMQLSIRAFKVEAGLGVIITDISEHKISEEALQESERRYRELADLLPLSVFEIDGNGVLTFVNRKFIESAGYTGEENNESFQLLVPGDRERARKNFLGMLSGDSSVGTEYTALRGDGTTFPVLVYSSAIIRDGMAVGLRGIAIDMTERKRSEQALRESESRLNRYLEGALDGIYTVDPKGRFLYVNKAIQRLIGYSRKEMIGKSFIELGLVSRDYLSKGIQTLERVVSGKPSTTEEFEVVKKGGDRIFVEISSFPMGRGEKTEIVAVIRDITERKKMEEALHSSEEKVRSVLNSSIDKIYRLNLSTGTYDYVSPASLQVLGYTPEEYISLGLQGAISLVHPDDVSILIENALNLVSHPEKEEAFRTVEYRFKHKVLGYRWFSDHRSVVYDADKRPVAVVGTLRDVTERKRADEELKQYIQALEFLSQTAMELVEFTSDRDIYGFIGDKLKSLVDDAVIFVNSFDESSETFKIRVVHNLEQYRDAVDKLIGKPLTEVAIPISVEARMGLSLTILVEVPGGIYQLACGGLPESACKQIEQILGVGGVYCIGFTWGGKLVGSAAFLVPKNRELEHKHSIETLINQSAVLMQKWQAEKALRDSEEKLRRMFEAVTDGICVTDLEGTITDINAGSLQLYGAVNAEALVGKNALNLIAASERETAAADMQHTLEQGASGIVEHKLLRADGSEYYGELSASVLKDAYGEPIGFISTIRDITKRKQAEEALQERLKFESLLSGISSKFINLPAAEVDRQIHDVLGLLVDFLGVDRSTLFEVAEEGALFKVTHSWAVDGIEPLPAYIPSELLPYCSKKVLSGETFMFSRPEDLPDEAAVDRSVFLLMGPRANLTIPLKVGTSVLGALAFGTVHCGRAWPDELVQRMKLVAQLLANALERKRTEEELAQYRYNLEELVQKRTYQVRTANTQLKQEVVDHQKAEHELKRYYNREKKLRRQLEEEMKKRVEFTRALAHELKTPLTPVMMSSQILTNALKDNEILLRLASNINRGAHNLNSRIDELLDLARGEVGMLRIRPERMNLLELLQEVIEEVAPVPLSRGQSLEAKLAPAKPPSLPLITADRGRVKQIVFNLLNNAFKYSPEGGVITLSAKQEDSSIIVEVRDTGQGISKKEQERIFNPYYRVGNERDRLSGLGLGLGLCKMLVELHQGQIWVKSRPGRGSTFAFSLPIHGLGAQKEKA